MIKLQQTGMTYKSTKTSKFMMRDAQFTELVIDVLLLTLAWLGKDTATTP